MHAFRRARPVALALLAGLAALPACRRAEEKSAPATPAAGTASEAPSVPHDVAVLQIKDLGTIRIELLRERAPKTVENFEKLARDGFYAGTTFHRVIPGFMIQGGDPLSKDRDPRNDGQGGPGYRIDAEFNETKHVRGVVSMARGSNKNSAGSQFFIMLASRPDLDGQYTAFGRVIEGMDVVDRIAAVEIDKYGRYGPPDRPMQNVVIESVAIETPGGAPAAQAAPPDTAPAPAPAPSVESGPPPGTTAEPFPEKAPARERFRED